MGQLSVEERQEAAMAALESRRLAVTNQVQKALTTSYLENTNVKEFNRQLRSHGFSKIRKSIKLGTLEETNNEIQDYFDICDEYAQLPSIKSLCMYLGISVQTYNVYLRDTESEYSEIFRAAIDYIHSVIEGGAMNNKVNPATYMFTASNFYGMRDSKSIDISAINPIGANATSSRDSLNALKAQVEKENDAKNIEFVEKDDISE